MASSTALLLVIIYFVFLFMTMVAHEYAHAWMANMAGDYTAEAQGRLTINPLAHIDLFWTVLMPIASVTSGIPLVCGPKPVPINPYRFRKLYRDYRLVSVAGVAVNFIIVVLLSVVVRLMMALGFDLSSPVVLITSMVMVSNLFMIFFNLLPIPPLDGSRILRTFLPQHLTDTYDRMDRYGMMILIGLVAFAGEYIWWIVRGGTRAVFHYVLRLDPDMFHQILLEYFKLLGAIKG